MGVSSTRIVAYIHLRGVDPVSLRALQHNHGHLRGTSESKRKPVAEAARRVEAARFPVALLLHVRAPPTDAGAELLEDAPTEETDLPAVRVPGEREVVAL